MDPSAVLQPMPLNGLINAHMYDNDGDGDLSEQQGNPPPQYYNHEGHPVLPRPLPDLVTRPYTQVVTTIVSHAILQTDYFGLEGDDDDDEDDTHIPRGIYMTTKGKAIEHNITSIAQIDHDVYKLFSNNKLSRDVLETYFGSTVKVEYVKIWGGPYGGATPDYQGQGITTDFLLYDGATGLHGAVGDSDSSGRVVRGAGALYYPNAMETTFAWYVNN